MCAINSLLLEFVFEYFMLALLQFLLLYMAFGDQSPWYLGDKLTDYTNSSCRQKTHFYKGVEWWWG